ncbi:hypothetical protein HDA32_003919 [Spinactinospora alkalitolerans]|uniref:Antitoxin n=1 Tax=Spinactinospora alkalitolerans TaxID=687207 RepID=A0A852TXS3_9ACTN|nr:hypothetical protein [Spinactinospora alkalitolerans]NYE48799.1 hypothetical protein [Spinactinospora alkalitolerans]
MVALQIRDVPEELRDALACDARLKGQSLQSYLLDLVGERARMVRAKQRLRLLEDMGGGVGDDDPNAVAEALRAARAERDAQLLGRWEPGEEPEET